MRISLSSPVRKAAFLSGSVILVLCFWILACQSFVSYWIARHANLPAYERASRLQPLDAWYLRVLGDYYVDRDHAKAAQYFEKALQLNPHSAATWLELASAYDLLGEPQKQHNAINQALVNAPKDVTVEWEAANLFIAQGDLDPGLRLMREVAANDPARTPMATQIAFNATGGNVTAALDVLPATVPVRLQFLHWLVDREHMAEADRVWPAILSASGALKTKDSFFYFDTLIARHQVNAAQVAWTNLLSRDPELGNRLEPGNMVVNGDFEDNLLNGGFDWRYHALPDIAITMDTSTFHGGTRSLAMQFDATDTKDVGLYQVIPVEPGGKYSLRAFLHAEELESANGVRIAVSDYYSRDVLLLTDEALGSFPWRETTGEFTAGPDTQLVKLTIARSPDVGRIRGRFWIDDVRLEKR